MRRRTFLGLAAASAAAVPIAHAGEGIGQVGAVSVGRATGDLADAIDAGVASITALSPTDAWSRLFRPDDRVAIKLNCLAPALSPQPAIVEALIGRLQAAGVKPGNIVVFERTSRELERAGYPIQLGGNEPRCFGTDALARGGYGSEIREHRSIGSLFSQVLTNFATALINVGVCKDHDLSGVSAGCKNLYGLIHNPNRYHENRCDPFLADLLDHPAVRPKLKLTVIDAIQAQCQGGPAFSPDHLFRPEKLLLSLDPVAIDTIAWEMIERERARRGLPTLAAVEREPTWIATAGGLGLGEAKRERITVREVDR